jgi:hypothetical protein
LRRDGYSPEEIVELIAELEREELARYERKREQKNSPALSITEPKCRKEV